MVAQVKLGALRDFQAGGFIVHLVMQGMMNELSAECEKKFLVHVVPAGAITADEEDNLVKNCSKQTLYHFDTWEEAQKQYLSLADQYGAVLKIREWSAKNWISN